MDTLVKAATFVAGRAVMAARLGASVGIVTVASRRSANDNQTWQWQTADAVRSRILHLLAGWAAVRAAGLDKPGQGCVDDFSQAAALVRTWKLGRMAGWQHLALVAMQLPENKLAVRLVAERLERDGEVSGDLFMLILQHADDDISAAELAELEEHLRSQRGTVICLRGPV
jgi:hypothetical protein